MRLSRSDREGMSAWSLAGGKGLEAAQLRSLGMSLVSFSRDFRGFTAKLAQESQLVSRMVARLYCGINRKSNPTLVARIACVHL